MTTSVRERISKLQAKLRDPALSGFVRDGIAAEAADELEKVCRDLEYTMRLLSVAHFYAKELSVENGIYEAGTEQEIESWLKGHDGEVLASD